jgi:hypothetical protein
MEWIICLTTETSEELTFGYDKGQEIRLPSQELSSLDNVPEGTNAIRYMAQFT